MGGAPQDLEQIVGALDSAVGGSVGTVPVEDLVGPGDDGVDDVVELGQLAGLIYVRHRLTHLAVFAPGFLVRALVSRPRNRLLARAFRSLGLIEELGTGIGRMYRSMLRLGKAPPSFETTAESVRVSLDGGSAVAPFARSVASLDASLRDDVEALLVLRRLCEVNSASSTDMAPLFQRTVDAAAASLRRIAEAPTSFVEPVYASGSRARVRYRLT